MTVASNVLLDLCGAADSDGNAARAETTPHDRVAMES